MEIQLQQIGQRIKNHHEVAVDEEVEVKQIQILLINQMNYKHEIKQILILQHDLRMIILQTNIQNDKIIQKNSKKLMNLPIKMELLQCQQFKEQIWIENLPELLWLKCYLNMQ